jgi:hypothetical protein
MVSQQPEYLPRMGEDDPGEVKGVLTLLRGDVRFSVAPGASTVSDPDGDKARRSLPWAWSGRIWTSPFDEESP